MKLPAAKCVQESLFVLLDDDPCLLELWQLASNAAKQAEGIDPYLTTTELIDAFQEEFVEARKLREKISEIGEKLDLEGTAEYILEGIEERIEGEGMGSDVRTQAVELLKDLGFDTTILEPLPSSTTVLPLDDSQILYALRQQLPNISNQ